MRGVTELIHVKSRSTSVPFVRGADGDGIVRPGAEPSVLTGLLRALRGFARDLLPIKLRLLPGASLQPR
jgi:hypothetical protein